MNKLKYSLAALALVALLASCDKAEMPGFLTDPDAVRIEAAVGALTRSNPLGTQDEQKKFNEGDRIAVTNGSRNNVVYKTVVYKLQNGTWTPENEGEYLKWDKSKLWFQVEYPAGYTELPTDQSTLAKLASADDMYISTSGSIIPENRTLSVNLYRQNVLVKIKIAGYLDQYDKDVHKINFVTIGQGSTWGGNDRTYMVEKPLVQDADGKIIEDETFCAGTVGYTYSGIVCPNETRNDGLRFIHLQVSESNNQNVELLDVKGVPELKWGHAYTFELYVGKETVKVGSVTVENWTGQTIDEVGETDAVDTWDGQTTEAFATQDAEGNELGSETSPILINSCAQLAYLAQQVNDVYTYENKYFKLTDDLNLADKKWTPIGEMSGCFSGHFDGNNHEIFGLKVEGSQYYAGLFGRIVGGSVKNVNIRSGSVKTNNDAHDSAAGGIAGHINNGRIENCKASVNVSGLANVGGVVGYIIDGSVLNCHFLSGEIDGGESVGGIVGNVGYEQTDKNTVSGCSADASVKGNEKVGGLCGWFGKGNHKFSNCTMKGSVTVAGNSCGGLVGYLSSSIGTFTDCKFEGSIKKDGSTVSNTGIAIGYDESAVTFSGCVCMIDNQTYMALNGWEAGNKDDDYIGIEVTTK